MTSTIAPSNTCPKCARGLISERDAVAWCQTCEWNLDLFEPKRRRRELSWAWQDRLSFRLAYRMNARQFEAMRGGTLTPPTFSVADAFVTATSVLMLAFVVGLAALGIYVAFYTEFIIPWFIGGLLVLIAVGLRPRLGKLDERARQISRDDAPELFRLIEEVTAAIGGKPPHVVLAVPGMTAYAHAYGIRHRRVLALGMPLWVALAPQQRVALLGHEVGHFVNGDVASKPLNVMAFATLGSLADMTRPARGGGFLGLLAAATMSIVHHALGFAQMCVTAAALRSTQRAEYYADALAAWAGGSRAAIGLMDVLLLSESMSTVIRAAGRRSNDVTEWIAAGQRAQADLAPRMSRLRQLDKRDDASLFNAHPPSALRAAMIESRGDLAPAIVLTEAVSARIDAELATAYRYMVRNT